MSETKTWTIHSPEFKAKVGLDAPWKSLPTPHTEIRTRPTCYHPLPIKGEGLYIREADGR